MAHLIFVCKYRKKLLIKYGTQIKQIFSYRIWRQSNNHIYLEKQLWNKSTFWGDGYFACSIGNVSKEIIEKYIQNQG